MALSQQEVWTPAVKDFHEKFITLMKSVGAKVKLNEKGEPVLESGIDKDEAHRAVIQAAAPRLANGRDVVFE